MKSLATTITLLLCLNFTAFAQLDESQFDTLQTYDVNLDDMMTTFGRKYLANGKEISKEQYQLYKDLWGAAENCRPCILHTYNERGVLKTSAAQYGECLIGSYRAYHPNGKLKVEGSFRQNPGNDWSNLRMRNLCSVREGKWTYYNEAGKIDFIEYYEQGKVARVEQSPESGDKGGNALQKLKGAFKGKGD